MPLGPLRRTGRRLRPRDAPSPWRLGGGCSLSNCRCPRDRPGADCGQFRPLDRPLVDRRRGCRNELLDQLSPALGGHRGRNRLSSGPATACIGVSASSAEELAPPHPQLKAAKRRLAEPADVVAAHPRRLASARRARLLIVRYCRREPVVPLRVAALLKLPELLRSATHRRRGDWPGARTSEAHSPGGGISAAARAPYHTARAKEAVRRMRTRRSARPEGLRSRLGFENPPADLVLQAHTRAGSARAGRSSPSRGSSVSRARGGPGGVGLGSRRFRVSGAVGPKVRCCPRHSAQESQSGLGLLAEPVQGHAGSRTERRSAQQPAWLGSRPGRWRCDPCQRAGIRRSGAAPPRPWRRCALASTPHHCG